MSDPSSESGSLRLPDGTLLLHIGPHKTGTTSIQSALWAARAPMRQQGVRFVGSTRNPARAAQAVTGHGTAYDTTRAPFMTEWRILVRQARPAGGARCIVSSEFFAHADPDAARRIVADLGPQRVQLVVTLRPLARIIPSMWQQNVQAGLKVPLETWTSRLFTHADARGPATFWRLHRHDALVRRWADVVGAENVTVIAVDDSDHASIHATFETMLGLRTGTLDPDADRRNRSLTLEETEAIRAFNILFEADGLDPALRARVMRFGAAEYMTQLPPLPTDTRIGLPATAIDPVRDAAAAIVDGVRASGVRIVGDLDRLLWVPDPGSGGATAGVTSPEAAARMAMGLALATGKARRRSGMTSPEQALEDARILRAVPTPQLASAMATRTRELTGIWQGKAVGRVQRGGARVRGWIPGGGSTTPAPEPAPPLAAGPSHVPVQTSTGEPVAAYPPGTILLHIGPPKTGTTGIQASFFAAREETRRQGVDYPGETRHSISAIHALLGRTSFRTDGLPPSMEFWNVLQKEIRESKAEHIVLSSEFFSDAPPDKIEHALDVLGRDRVQVVVTLRPIARIIPSQWQQYVQSNLKVPFGPWLESILSEPPGNVTPTFWQRHHHDRLIARWAAIVGTDRVTGIVMDERDHGMVLRAFEALTGLRPGTLAVQDTLANRSLTLPEIEMVRQVNILFSEAGLTRPQHSMLVNFGATEYLKTLPADPDAPKVALPGWTLERTAELAREIVDGIGAAGIRLIGDLDSLLVVPAAATAQPLPEVTRIPASVAGRLAMGVLYAADLARPGVGAPRRRILPPRMAEPIDVTRIPTVTLTKAMARRVIPGLE